MAATSNIVQKRVLKNDQNEEFSKRLRIRQFQIPLKQETLNENNNAGNIWKRWRSEKEVDDELTNETAW